MTPPVPTITTATRPGEPADDALIVRLLSRILVEHEERRREGERSAERGCVPKGDAA